MRIGIPKETHHEEKRVSLAPAGVDTLVNSGHTVFVQSEAGEGSHFSDEDYIKVGATLVYSKEEVYQRSELIAQVSSLSEDEIDLLEEHQIVNLKSEYKGVIRKANNFKVVGYDIPKNCCATYFPETNVLVPLDSFAHTAKTPASKSVIITVEISN